LDSKHRYLENDTAGDNMIRSDSIHIIPATDHTVETLEMMLSGSEQQAFPIVTSLQEMQLVGYAGKAELLHAINRAKLEAIPSDAACLFIDPQRFSDASSILDLRPWMDSTPFTIHPRLPMTLVLEIFKKLGLGSVLVTRRGKLCGIITKIDLLHHLNFLNDPSGNYRPVSIWNRETG
jgi:chloride channel 3/4/5